MAIAEEEPDVVIACVGGGSNFAGLAFPYYRRKLEGKSSARLVPSRPGVPTHRGRVPLRPRRRGRHDAADADVHPGHDFVPAGIHAGGLRYTANPAREPADRTRARWRRSPSTRRSASTPPSRSRARRAFCRHPSRATRSVRRSTRRLPRRPRRGPLHPVQPLGPRSLRPRRVRGVQLRQAAGLRLRLRHHPPASNTRHPAGPGPRRARAPPRVAPKMKEQSTTCTARGSRYAG